MELRLRTSLRTPVGRGLMKIIPLPPVTCLGTMHTTDPGPLQLNAELPLIEHAALLEDR